MAAGEQQSWSPLGTSTSAKSSPDYATVFPNISFEPPPDEISTCAEPAPTAESDPQLPAINKALVYKLQHFKRPPVNHFFHRPQERTLHTAPIPHSRMRIVDSPKEENFHQGTLHFLSEFVTAQHYPPKDAVKHVLQSILLEAEEQSLKNEAYMVLMKMQKLHPATLTTVAWDWNLLSEAIGKKDHQTCHLFFQYVLQTVDDDFQIHVQRRSFQKSLCKAMLSCDKCSSNIKNVIDWLICAVENACREDKEFAVCFQWEERLVFLLQRMLSIAVEVDNSPVISSNRIAELLFPRVIVLKTRQQREMFLSSTENFLLRAKILEIIFENSCESMPDPGMPLSLYRILHFVGNSTLLLENQGPEWQRWDELLHHICLLYFSLQKLTTDHLRTPITDRTDELIQRPQTYFPVPEDLTENDIIRYLNLFWKRTSFGMEVPEPLKNRFQMLKSFLLLNVQKQIL
ncbi:SUMO-interacting motif-containing protein 1 [Gastrophryne carolinensis]